MSAPVCCYRVAFPISGAPGTPVSGAFGGPAAQLSRFAGSSTVTRCGSRGGLKTGLPVVLSPDTRFFTLEAPHTALRESLNQQAPRARNGAIIWNDPYRFRRCC